MFVGYMYRTECNHHVNAFNEQKSIKSEAEKQRYIDQFINFIKDELP